MYYFYLRYYMEVFKRTNIREKYKLKEKKRKIEMKEETEEDWES